MKEKRLTISASCYNFWSTLSYSKSTNPINSVDDFFMAMDWVHRKLWGFQIP